MKDKPKKQVKTMGVLKAVLVDDEELGLEQMQYVFKGCNDLKIVGSFSDSETALAEIKVLKPDVLFLDVSMPDKDGFQMAKEIRETGDSGFYPYIVYITAHNEYAWKAFEVEALDYILKPVSKERVYTVVERIKKRIDLSKRVGKGDSTRLREASTTSPNWVAAEERGCIVIIPIAEVHYFSAQGKSTIVYTSRKSLPTDNTLSAIEDKFGARNFFRCHKSYIVNLDYVDRIIPMFNQNYIIKLRDRSEEIPVSRHYSKELKAIFGM
ncbi:LytR/AlgR family response regulator transcription factor [Desulfosporosinus youngiae]|uniref:Stage 0 sporulation protein A homolog n=1 Tax=Desulfosporosinus youngiae DSM 17734 TaxID=768710 RepID=H5XV77_9FIRM|nr:LytTR family DNA-binding domain-containing protein [Desulfosporosinus youngiae]EHQ89675.1 response regulator of the LytR/AlgR family [Desulfosporosinus youngiae DSM 17734]